MLRTSAPLIGALGVSREKEKRALSIITDVSLANPAERNARVLSALGEPGGDRRSEVLALARLALSFVRERARLALGPFSRPSLPFARVLLALGEAGCGLALCQSSVGRLARHCVGSRARQKTICLAGVRRHLGRWALKPDELRRLTSQSKGRLRAAHFGAPHWRVGRQIRKPSGGILSK